MKNKKIILIIVLVIIVVSAIGFGVYIATHSPNYLYNQDGTITDGKEQLIERLQNIEDKEERKKQISAPTTLSLK